MNAQANPRSPLRFHFAALRICDTRPPGADWGPETEDRENNLVLDESIFILDYTGSSFSNMVKKNKTPNKI